MWHVCNIPIHSAGKVKESYRKQRQTRLCKVLVHVTFPYLRRKTINELTKSQQQTNKQLGEVGCSTSVWKPGLGRTPTLFLQRLLTHLSFFQIWRLLTGILGKEGFPPLLLSSPVLPDSLEIRFNYPGASLLSKKSPGDSNIQLKLRTTAWEWASLTPRTGSRGEAEIAAGFLLLREHPFSLLCGTLKVCPSCHWLSVGHCGRQDVVNKPALQWILPKSP